MNIVVLDGYTLNPGDLSWAGFERIGNCTIYNNTPQDELCINRALEAEIILTNKVQLSKEVIERLPNLKYIGVLATGFNNIDIKSAGSRCVPVTNIPEYGTESVAQMVFAHMLNLSLRVDKHCELVRDGRWGLDGNFCFWDNPLIELSGKTIGIIGMGRIGRAVARIAIGFNMNVLAFSRRAGIDVMHGIRYVSFEDVIKESDFLTIHCPLTDDNENLIGAKELKMMKRTAFLINTSRGKLIDELALANALNDGTINGAGIDVLSNEPPDTSNPLLLAKNCYITPHISWATFSARSRLMDMAENNLRSFVKGTPQNVVNECFFPK